MLFAKKKPKLKTATTANCMMIIFFSIGLFSFHFHCPKNHFSTVRPSAKSILRSTVSIYVFISDFFFIFYFIYLFLLVIHEFSSFFFFLCIKYVKERENIKILSESRGPFLASVSRQKQPLQQQALFEMCNKRE